MRSSPPAARRCADAIRRSRGAGPRTARLRRSRRCVESVFALSTTSTAASGSSRSFRTPPRSTSRSRCSGEQRSERTRPSRSPRSTRWAGAASTTRWTAAFSGTPRPATGSCRSEKLLDMNAALLRLYVDAGARCGCRASPSGPRRCDTSRPGSPIRSTEDGPDRSVPTPVLRRRGRGPSRVPAPPVGRTLYRGLECRDGVGGAAGRRVIDDDGAPRIRAESLERVLLGLQARRRAWLTTTTAYARVRGLLADQIAMAAAASTPST